MTPTIKLTVLVAFFAISSAASAQVGGSRAGGDERWNISGPAWYETQCGLIGFSVTHGLPYANNWRKPCSVPIRVCEYKSVTINYPADPDVPCEKMANPATVGELQRTYIKRWD
jgi:hypothetical protein